jgi:hypothetical protein
MKILSYTICRTGMWGKILGTSARRQWLDYRLDDRGWIPGKDRDVCLRHRVQTDCPAHSFFLLICTRALFSGVSLKRLVCEAKAICN